MQILRVTGILIVAMLLGFSDPTLQSRALAAESADIPEYQGEFFTDLTGTLSGREKVEVSKTLNAAAQSSRIHPMLVLINKMSDYPGMPQQFDAFANKLAQAWKIGDHKTKKGVLVLFSLDDRKFGAVKTANVPQSVADSIKQSMVGRVTDSLKSEKITRAMVLASQNIAMRLPNAARKAATSTRSSPRKTVTKTTRTRRHLAPTYSGRTRSSGGSGWGWIIGIGIVIFIVMIVFGSIGGSRHGYGGGMGGGYYGGGGGFFSGMLTGGLLGYMFGGGMGHSHYGRGSYGSDYEETTTTESWTDGGDSISDAGDFDVGGFDSFGGGDFDGGGSFGEW